MNNKSTFIIHFFSISSFLFCILNRIRGFELLFLLPLLFEILFYFSSLSILKRETSLTFKIVGIIAMIRYCLLPVLIIAEPNYHIAEYYCTDMSYISKAILYMCYELLFIYIFFLINSNTSRNQIKAKNAYINANKSIKFYLVFAFIILLSNPSTFGYLNFFKLDSSTASRVGSIDLSTTDYILRQILLMSILLSFIIIAHWSSHKYSLTNKKKYIFIAVIGAIFCISTIVGEQRSNQVYTGFACIYIMRKLFPDHKKQISSILCSIAILVLALLSIYKTFFAFNYNSYIDAITQSSSENLVSYQGEIYLLGPISVASALEMKDTWHFNFNNLIYDFFRSTIGLSFLVKDSGIDSTSVIYNEFVSHGTLKNGYLIQISAHGALYFGYIFGPILICIFYKIALFLERLMDKSKYLFVQFFAAYVYIRFSTCMVSCNINTLLTMSSIILLFTLPVYLIQKAITSNGKS